jgi:hypothetical protein
MGGVGGGSAPRNTHKASSLFPYPVLTLISVIRVRTSQQMELVSLFTGR